MKIVSKVFDENNVKFLVSDSLVKTGYFFGEQDDMLLDLNKETLDSLLNEFNKSEYRLFWLFLQCEKDIAITALPSERYVPEEEVEEWVRDYKYFYNANDNSIGASAEIKIYQLCDYIEYWDGNNIKQDEVYIEEENVKLVESNIYSDDKTSHIDLYKLSNGSYVINHVSYYQGDLGHCEAITIEQLKQKFGYVVEE
ncbi:MAG: hypothetical protein Q8936_21690 [Bacillota bacterium]|nr:hypothetical protein [Bacillota bacterium]